MSTADDSVPCPLAEGRLWHPAHTWTHMVPDPENDHVIHIFTDPEASLSCPGWNPNDPAEER